MHISVILSMGWVDTLSLEIGTIPESWYENTRSVLFNTYTLMLFIFVVISFPLFVFFSVGHCMHVNVSRMQLCCLHV